MIQQKTISRNKIMKYLIFLGLFTASFDIVGIVHIAGFNFRLSQFIFLLVFISVGLRAVKKKKLVATKYSVYLLIFIVLQVLMLRRSPSLKNAISYALWLVFNALIVLSIENVVTNELDYIWLFRAQLMCYKLIAVLGMVQFLLHLIGIDFFLTQHIWIWNLTRVNGFTYEPSFYSTYILLGFVQSAYLVEVGEKKIISSKECKNTLLCTTIALIISGSRMGWLMILLWGAYRIIKIIKDSILTHKINKYGFITVILSIIIIISLTYALSLNLEIYQKLFYGLGLYGTAGHSRVARLSGLGICIDIFKQSPWWGYSLGGVDPVIYKYLGIVYSTEKNGRATSIIGELLVGCGIIGLLPFFAYFGEVIKQGLRSYRTDNTKMALTLALIFELIILCFNQNILREYVWTHLAILCTALNYHYETDNRRKIY